MGKLLGFGSHKGGVGKSTQAINVAVFLTLAGKKVAFLELDDQRSIADAVEARSESSALPPIDYYECYTDIVERARKLAEKYDFVVIDTPGRKSPEFRKALACVDILLTFIEPGAQVEINTLAMFVNDVKTAQASLNPSMQAFIVLNKSATDPRDTEASELRKMLNDDPDWLPVPRQRIYSRKAHKGAYNAGMGVHEFNDKQGNKARGEIEILLKEVGII
ncbi:peptidyl-arginine deiminase [bacteria symbiont BFo1 of Frankliniella occidentalis]|uniref:ParA family protein n=1 Tax=Erwinia TaxID=551 RepID=UPI00066465A2|nr:MULTISPECIES: ParA family protein [Erwinia]KMV67536.1 peptidyl-arginine deiminase [bacteria symbiont BFo1 of Frankliniella occidentalis]KYP82382.1 peptidyl-arginine deiminase [bacteria symbiont BFo1 of Frankliniella occidentalis]KYP87045.1 peptidyl-arginine deiminase [bacteria symbiont BFo1 of Frankliniella occidentalis]MDI3440219.1 ParA family protein [Erwinia sp. V90_4]CAH0296656.1 Chromosome-partitioning ATPase Soj [Erwinia aphidicola]